MGNIKNNNYPTDYDRPSTVPGDVLREPLDTAAGKDPKTFIKAGAMVSGLIAFYFRN